MIETIKSLDKGPISASPRDIHNVSESETYSPLDVSSIHKTSDRRISSENLFTSPDTSKGEEEVKKAVESSGLSDAITCAQRTVVEPGLYDAITCAQRTVVEPGLYDAITCAQRTVVEPGMYDAITCAQRTVVEPGLYLREKKVVDSYCLNQETIVKCGTFCTKELLLFCPLAIINYLYLCDPTKYQNYLVNFFFFFHLTCLLFFWQGREVNYIIIVW